MTTVGNLMMALSALAAMASIGALAWGRMLGAKDGESVTNWGYFFTFGLAGTLTVAVGTLLAAFFRQDFSFEYVALNHSTDVSSLAWLYKVSGVWAGREGSLLFWAWLLALFGAYVAWKRIGETDELSNASLMVFNIVQLLFVFALLIDLNNPFKLSDPAWLGANGELLISAAMNPLLQHWAMILHPPTLFIGYAGLTVPFAFAMGALIVGDGSKRWVQFSDRITVFSWLFLGIGIGLGAIWAYVVLGWGGFWAWDPVENASLLPWLTGVGLLHSFTVYRRREGFKKWAVWMATVSFVLVILGTFITRSGIVQSVHAFEKDPLSAWLFGAMMVIPLVVTFFGLQKRSKEFSGNDDFESLVSKESSYYFNNVLMLLSAIMVAVLTVAPAFGGKTYGPATYDSIARPVGILYVFIMAVCPLLSWRKTEGPMFWSKAKWPLMGTVALSVPLLYFWYSQLLPIFQKTGTTGMPALVHNAYAVSGLVVGSFAASISVYLFIAGASKRAAAKGESFFSALGSIMFKARTQSGGYLTHLGIAIILIGLVGSAMFVDERLVMVPNVPGSQFEVSDYTFTYNGITDTTLDNGDAVSSVNFDVAKNGTVVGQVNPGQVSFFRQQQTKLNAAVRVEFLQDVFVVFQGIQGDQLSMQVKINPLISWAWFGFALTVVGASIAMWPKPEARALPPVARSKSKK